jgi:hypothetical protein
VFVAACGLGEDKVRHGNSADDFNIGARAWWPRGKLQLPVTVSVQVRVLHELLMSVGKGQHDHRPERIRRNPHG